MLEIFSSNQISVLFYCFGIIIPTITLLFSYGNFAFQIGEYHLESQEKHMSLPIVLILILTKLFLVSFVMFFIYNYTFDHNIFTNSIMLVKCFLWGMLCTVDNFFLNKEIKIIRNEVRYSKNFNKALKCAIFKMYKKYQLLYAFKIICTIGLIVTFIFSIFTNNLSFITVLLIIYIYYNIQTYLYIKRIHK